MDEMHFYKFARFSHHVIRKVWRKLLYIIRVDSITYLYKIANREIVIQLFSNALSKSSNLLVISYWKLRFKYYLNSTCILRPHYLCWSILFPTDAATGQWTRINVSSPSSPELDVVGTLIAACAPVHAWLGLHRCNWVGGFPICITVEDVAALRVTNGTDTHKWPRLPTDPYG